MNNARQLIKDEDGSSMAEYVLLAGLIAIVVIVGATSLGNATNNKLEAVGNRVQSTPSPF